MAQLAQVVKTTAQLKKSNFMAGMIDYIIRAINDVDETVVLDRVTKLRAARPDASPETLSNILIKQKCLQAGTVGAVTSGMAMVPGGGALVTFTFGVAADLSLTLKMQAELVLEIAAVYERHLRRTEKRQVILLVTGMSAASDQLLSRAGTTIAKKASKELAIKSAEKAIPVLSVAASAGKNILTTYIVGKRAQAYFSLGPEAVGDWSESVKAITGIDFQRLVAWLTETTERSWQLMTAQTQSITAATIVAGRSAGEVVVLQVDKMSQQLAKIRQSMVDKTRSTGQMTLNLSRRVGSSMTDGLKTIAGQATATTQKTMPAWPYLQKSPQLTGDSTEADIQAILDLADASERVEQVIAGCSDIQEVWRAFEIYFSKGMSLPFDAIWRDPDEVDHVESVTALQLGAVDPRRGLLFKAQHGPKTRRILAEQLWLENDSLPNAMILNDYRYWLEQLL